MVAKILDHNNGELKQGRRRQQRERRKTNRFILAKQQLCTCITLFCTILSGRCTIATWNFLISRTRSMELVNTAQNFSFSFSKLRYGPFGFNPRESRQHLTNWMKLNKIDEVWNSANSFSKCRFWFVVIQKFCYRGNVTYRLLLYTYSYSPKNYVVSFRTQISSSQSESRTMFFHVWEKWYVQSEATEVCEFRAKITAFYCSVQQRFAYIQREKF